MDESLIKVHNGVEYYPCGRFDHVKEVFGGMSLNWHAKDPYLVQYVVKEHMIRRMTNDSSFIGFNWGYMYEYVTIEQLDHLWEMSINNGRPEQYGSRYDLIPIFDIDEYNVRLEARLQEIDREKNSDILMCHEGLNLIGMGKGKATLVKGGLK